MEDPFAYLLKYTTISESQAQYLHRCNFELEGLSLQENSSASESTPLDPIIICSLPMDSMDEDETSSVHQEEDCFQTPEEKLPSQNPDEKIDGIGGGESSVAVDLGRDTDLVFSEIEMSKNGILMGESCSSKGELGVVKSKKVDFDLNDVPYDAVSVDGVVHEPRDEETENVYSEDVEMDISPLVPCVETTGTVMVDSETGEGTEFPENSQLKDREKDLENEMSNAIETMEVQDKFEISDSNGGNANLVSGASQGVRKLPDWIVEFAQRGEGLGGRRGGSGDDLNLGRESEEQRLTEAGSSSQGQANLVRGGRGLGRGGRRGGRRNRLSSGREEQSLTGVHGHEMHQEENSANVNSVTRNSSGENATKAYVKLSDLVNGDDNDILAVAIKAGMKFPRPRWWRPEGYGPVTRQ